MKKVTTEFLNKTSGDIGLEPVAFWDDGLAAIWHVLCLIEEADNLALSVVQSCGPLCSSCRCLPLLLTSRRLPHGRQRRT